MQLGTVVGRATATVKHPTLAGQRLLLVQPLDVNDAPDGDPQLVIDELGAGRGDRVLLTTDGAAIREMIKADNSPLRWAVIGIAD